MAIATMEMAFLFLAVWWGISLLEGSEAAVEVSITTTTNSSTKTSYRIDGLRESLQLDWSSDEQWKNNDDLSPQDAAEMAWTTVGKSMKDRMAEMFQKAQSPACRQKIAQHVGYFVHAMGQEETLPFADAMFQNECGETVYDWNDLPEGMHLGDIQNRTYQPPRNETEYLDDPKDLKLLYGILTHDDVKATIRLIEALYEPGHQFVIHVDKKYPSTQQALLEYAQGGRDHQQRTYIHILGDDRRVSVNWGGFSMVNATLQLLKHAFQEDSMIEFHRFVHISASSYPIASNPEIRHKLASYPLDANFFHVILQPSRMPPHGWHYFVECDDLLHRIFQLYPLRSETNGIDMFTSSQWFILSHEFAQYLAVSPSGSLADHFVRYAEHVVVADETYFGTVLRNTKFCHAHHNSNFLHLQFDRWESDIPVAERDFRKCPMPNPDHCGRSPTTMTIDYADILELSAELFARKFDDRVDTRVKDVIDSWRQKRAHAIDKEGVDPGEAYQMGKVEFEGHGVLIVAKDTVGDAVPLCLAIGETGNQVQLLPCFQEWVPATLATGWEKGGVVEKESVLHTRWEVGPCTTDGKLERDDETGFINVTLGEYSSTGPRCMLQQMDGIRSGRCWDGGPYTALIPGGPTQVYPCVREYFQFVAFGDDRSVPTGALYTTIPSHVVKQIQHLGKEQIPYMCLGVYERGPKDELQQDKESGEYNPTLAGRNRTALSNVVLPPLSDFVGRPIVTTQCNNQGAVVEWVIVPFIDEEGATIINPNDDLTATSEEL